MKYLASLLFITSFIGIAIVGSALFDMSLDHAGGCIASSVDGTTCPTTITDFATHHISTLQTLTRAIAPSDLHSLLLLLTPLLLVSTSLFLHYKNSLRQICQLADLLRRLRDLSRRSSCGRQKIISWLSLLELSPVL